MDKKRKYILALSCTLAAAMSCAAFLPTGAARTKEVTGFSLCARPGERIAFDREDFEKRATGDISGIIIEKLPEEGRLVCSGEELRQGSLISVDAIGAMYYEAASEGEGHAAFDFSPVFKEGGASQVSATVSLNLTDRDNTAPVAKNADYETYCDMPLTGRLTAFDPDGDEVTFRVTRQPQFGQVKVEGDAFTYTPSVTRDKKDSFAFAAVDELGGVSSEAEVRLSVKKRGEGEALTYSDMAASTAHYAAVRLAEKGVIRGESIGSVGFFEPDRTVSRAEFVTMISTLYDMPLPTAAVVTGMGDNDDIPHWAKPSVAAALSCQVVTGEQRSDGNRVFRADDPITKAEAAVVIDRIVGLKEDGRQAGYADAGKLPQWAEPSIIKTVSAGYLELDGDNRFNPSQPMTREDAALCLYKVMQADEKTDSFWNIFG